MLNNGWLCEVFYLNKVRVIIESPHQWAHVSVSFRFTRRRVAGARGSVRFETVSVVIGIQTKKEVLAEISSLEWNLDASFRRCFYVYFSVRSKPNDCVVRITSDEVINLSPETTHRAVINKLNLADRGHSMITRALFKTKRRKVTYVYRPYVIFALFMVVAWPLLWMFWTVNFYV